MTRTLFTDGWSFQREGDPAETAVRLPHDAMIGERRSTRGATGNHGGYFPGGTYVYRRAWTAPVDGNGASYRLDFEGVQGVTTVFLDGREVGRCSNPYREFSVPLGDISAGETALIEVHVDNTSLPNSRWYTGSGIYRPVWLDATGPTRISPDGVRFTTLSIDRAGGETSALVEIEARIENAGFGRATVDVEIAQDGEPIARRSGSVADGSARFEITIPEARLWSADEPNLYTVSVRVVDGDQTYDENVFRTGLRVVDVDARRGLRINGEGVLLRGTAVHHDNGPLGAVTLPAAERRRAQRLKDAGYNAIRSAHNPLSRAFLDACDELGLYVMDELTDVWYRHKTVHDGADSFRNEWRDDVAAMIAKDRNRPSVILYSIGNEIAESASPEGAAYARTIHEAFTSGDPTRPTTIAVNPLLAMMAARTKPASAGNQAPPERKPATSTAANQLTAKMGRLMVLASVLPAADRATRQAFDAVDIAGYNYGYASYPGARKRHPDRVILGTESMTGDLPAIWERVEAVPGVIGDFSWTGWDYLGEVGLGYWTYAAEPGGIAKPYPGILAGCGVFDITGEPTATLHLVQAVWGITSNPGIAVRPLDRAGERPNKTPWLSTDAVSSWSWNGVRGTAEIEVYSGADHVELLLNGRSLARRRAGAKKGYVARFRVGYEPGGLTAIAYRHGIEVGRSTLRSAGRPQLHLIAESAELHGPDDLAYVQIQLADADGIVDVARDDRVSVTVSGPAELAALGSAAPSTEDSFVLAERSTFRGRALAILRATGEEGIVTITVTSEHHGDATLDLAAYPARDTRAVETPFGRKEFL